MEYEFVYDHSIWSCDPKHPEFVGQEKLYKLMGQPLLNSAFEGYNTCLFAYGQVCYSDITYIKPGIYFRKIFFFTFTLTLISHLCVFVGEERLSKGYNLLLPLAYLSILVSPLPFSSGLHHTVASHHGLCGSAR